MFVMYCTDIVGSVKNIIEATVTFVSHLDQNGCKVYYAYMLPCLQHLYQFSFVLIIQIVTCVETMFFRFKIYYFPFHVFMIPLQNMFSQNLPVLLLFIV